MPRLWLALVFVSPAIAFAQATPPQFYQSIAGGEWVSDQGELHLSYSVGEKVVITGSLCTLSNDGLRECESINQDYVAKADDLYRELPPYGEQSVEILELTKDKLVKRETHPLDPRHIVITSEELTDRGLKLVSETWVSGQSTPQSHVEALLHRPATAL